MGDAQVVRPGGGDGGGEAGVAAQRPRRALGQMLGLTVQIIEDVINGLALGRGQLLIGIQQVIQVIPVPLGAGHPARAGVGLLQQAQFGEGRHFIAKGGAGHRKVQIIAQQAAAHRLTLHGIQGHDGLKHALLARVHCHKPCTSFLSFFSTPFSRVLSSFYSINSGCQGVSQKIHNPFKKTSTFSAFAHILAVCPPYFRGFPPRFRAKRVQKGPGQLRCRGPECKRDSTANAARRPPLF